MKKGQILETTTKVVDHFEAQTSDRWFGSVSLFDVYINEIYSLYVVEYDSKRTGMGIEHEMFDMEEVARDFYNSKIAEIKKDIIAEFQNEVA